MKINIIGNTCNNHYTIAKNLRQLGVDAHLYFDGRQDAQTFPESDDVRLRTEYPDWLHRYGEKEVGRAPFVGVSDKFHRELADCDLLHVEDCGVIWASQTGRPFVWDPYGYDLNHYPFYKFWHKRPASTFRNNPELIFAAYRFRRAMERASSIIYAIWYKDLAHGFELINRTCLDSNFIHNIPLSYDIDIFSPSDRPTMKNLLLGHGISLPENVPVIFHPARVMFTPSAYVSKGNDKLLRAIRHLKDCGIEYLLVMVDKGNPCEPAARELIKQLEITSNVVWIPKMPRHQLASWYKSADIVADDFSGGAPGSVVFEGMACAKPVISYFQTTSHDPSFWPIHKVYPEIPPIVNVHSEEEIACALKKLHGKPEERIKIGKASRVWMERYASGNVVAQKFIEHYEDILKKQHTIRRMPRNAHDAPILSIPDTLNINTPDEEKHRILDNIIYFLDNINDTPPAQATLIEYYTKCGEHSKSIAIIIQALQIPSYKNDMSVLKATIQTIDAIISHRFFSEALTIIGYASNIIGHNEDLETRRYITLFASGNTKDTIEAIRSIDQACIDAIIVKTINIMRTRFSPRLALDFVALVTTAGIKSAPIHDAIKLLSRSKL